jgi:hypothetical protein
LLIDYIVNPWLKNKLIGNEIKIIKKIPAPELFLLDQKKIIIDELKRLRTETSLQIAAKMETELNK